VTSAASSDVEETDVVVIGSGVGGLSCAGILSLYGDKVVVCESHYAAGGVAHAFKKAGYNFDSGPSFYTGLSKFPSVNPLGQVLHALDEPVPCVQYDTWIMYLPEGNFVCKTDAEKYRKELGRLGGPGAEADWVKLEKEMEPLSKAAAGLPAAALRFDPLVALTIWKFLPSVLASGPQAAMLQDPFKALMDKVGVRNEFVKNLCDLECFVLSGVPADGTITAEMAFMYGERNRKGSTIDYPLGGAEAVVNALVRGVEKHGGKIQLNSHVEQILMEGGRATGVRLSDGRVVKARKAVVSNASVWDTQRLLPAGAAPASWKKQSLDTPECDSFLHLHLGIDATGLPADLECHHVVVNDWSKGVAAEQNVVVISIPTVFDPKLAPEGKLGIIWMH
jgi:phytoene dehydrogenase-like protein